jgi:hypothetical protein
LYYPPLPKAWPPCPKKKIWLVFIGIRPKMRVFGVYLLQYPFLLSLFIAKLVTRRAIRRIEKGEYSSKARGIRRTRVEGIRGGVDGSNKEYFTTSAGGVVLL